MDRDTVYKTFRKVPVLETKRLELRKLKASDYIDMYEYAKKDTVTKYLLWRSHPDAQYTKDYLRYVQTQYRAGEFFDWAIVLKRSGKMIGTCGFARFDYDNNSAEIGYVINPLYWRRGYATEAVQRVIDFGFSKLNLHRIEARYMIGNDASRHVMEKCGMKFEGVHKSSLYVKEQYVDIGYCAITSDMYINSMYEI
ncbi:MAG: GNAT family N-acetyltransferase [Clostridia bacterium]|nr:GNAT family N-acetyltransferase [Clostridia bacterium]